MEKVSKKILIGVGALVIVGLIFFGGYKFGLSQEAEVPDTKLDESSENANLKNNFDLFWSAVNLVKDDYFRPDSIEDEKLLHGAIKGMVKSLDDPYSTFFNPEDAEKFSEDITGRFGGIGAQIGIKEGQLVVISPLKGNPAEKVGLKAGDKILKVDDTFTNDLSIDESVKIIRGERGTEVTLLIMREGWDESREFTITRDVIEVPTLDWEMKDGNIAYMQLYSFNANASQEFYNASFNALLQGANGIVLDLRNNSGGFLEVAINISGWFVDKGDIVVKERFPSGEVDNIRSQGSGVWGNVPVVVLVNGGSASASEIVAGALRDNLGAKLVGETTFGKGTVQQVKSLGDGSKIKISVAEWLTPEGSTIHETGLDPDIQAELTVENAEEGSDPQLEKALETVRQEAQNSEAKRTIIVPTDLNIE